MRNSKILLGHGSGGKLTSELIKKFFVENFNNEILDRLTDSAVFEMENVTIAFTTDSYVVDPIFFPGGDIGKLAVCGTVNDLAVTGAVPYYMSAAYIIEEGFAFDDLKTVSGSMAEEAMKAGIKIVTGDTKVVNRGQCDKIFINTAGIGLLEKKNLHIAGGLNIHPDDVIIVNGFMGDHGISVLGAREKINFEEKLLSDCCSLNHTISDLLNAGINVKFMRDLTRGGLGTVLAEICENRSFGMIINEKDVPVREMVKGTCEIFGFDPLYLANEGKFLLITDREDAERAVEIMKKNRDNSYPAVIGRVTPEYPGKSVMTSVIGGKRIIDKLTGEMLPRIC